MLPPTPIPPLPVITIAPVVVLMLTLPEFETILPPVIMAPDI
jgi:hypothetical protein